MIISTALAPVFGLTTEMIVGSAPPERAGTASGMSETSSELGGALGIAILGSIGVAIYRGSIARDLPSTVPPEAALVARDTLGGAVAVAGELPAELGAVVLEVARAAFVTGMQVGAIGCAVLAVGVAGLTVVLLRDVDPGTADERSEAAERSVAEATP